MLRREMKKIEKKNFLLHCYEINKNNFKSSLYVFSNI